MSGLWRSFGEIFLYAILIVLTCAGILWVLFIFIPSWHQKKQLNLPPLSPRDKTLQVIRDVYVKIRQGADMSCIRSLQPALASYLTEQFELDQLQFNPNVIERLRQDAKISGSEAQLLLETAAILEQAHEYKFPDSGRFMALTWELQNFVRRSSQTSWTGWFRK